MHKIMMGLLAAFLFAPVAVQAAEASGRIASWDEANRALALEDGTFCQVSEGLATDGLQPGIDVTIVYEGDGESAVCSEIMVN